MVTEHLAFDSHYIFNFTPRSDACSLPTWDRSPDVTFLYKIYLRSCIHAIIKPEIYIIVQQSDNFSQVCTESDFFYLSIY